MSSAGICEWTPTLEEEDEEWALELDAPNENHSELILEVARVNELLSAEGDESNHSKKTLDRAAEFLNLYRETICISGDAFPIPDIDLGPNGSVDIHWKLTNRELLVNIPGNSDETAVYYGDRNGFDPLRGSFETKEFNYEIAKCLMNE